SADAATARIAPEKRFPAALRFADGRVVPPVVVRRGGLDAIIGDEAPPSRHRSGYRPGPPGSEEGASRRGLRPVAARPPTFGGAVAATGGSQAASSSARAARTASRARWGSA